jgi:uncharacterized membrane protein YecN with MAPEG domain
MPLTPIYAALLAALFVVLSLRTILLRQQLGIPIGDGGNRKLRRAIRAHANFAEYVPLALLLMYFLETHTQARGSMHAFGIVLLAGRSLHAYGVSQDQERIVLRVTGMVLTFGVIALCAAMLLWHALRLAMVR